MTVCETYLKHANKKEFKPLTEKELRKGKDSIKIYKSKKKMPWDKVYTRIKAGQPLDIIAQKYGNIRKIVLWAIEDGIDVDEELDSLVDDKIEVDRKMNMIEAVNPNISNTLKEMVAEYAPDLATEVAKFSKKAVKTAQRLISDKECTSNDFRNITAGMQTLTDMTSLTERHNKVGGNSVTQVNVTGFDFVQDNTPVIEAEIVGDSEGELNDN